MISSDISQYLLEVIPQMGIHVHEGLSSPSAIFRGPARRAKKHHILLYSFLPSQNRSASKPRLSSILEGACLILLDMLMVHSRN